VPNCFAEKSEHTWAEGKSCLDHGMINAAANRIYYAVFQAVKGFAIHRNLWTMETSDSVHRDALKIVYGEGGKGIFFRRRLNELFALRTIADYTPEGVDKTELEELLKDADSIRRHHIQIAGGPENEK
jgi:uncharacterized protein (UPF0332 family)